MVNEDPGADSGGSAARMDAERGSEVCSLDEGTCLGELEVVTDTGGEKGVEDEER